MTDLYYWQKYTNKRVSHTGYTTVTEYTQGSWSPASCYYHPEEHMPMLSGYRNFSFSTSYGFTYSNWETEIAAFAGDFYNGSQTSCTKTTGYDPWDPEGDGTYVVAVCTSQISCTANTRTEPYTYYTNEKGTYVSTSTEPANAHVDNQLNSDGYWYVKGELVTYPPSTPVITSPASMALVNMLYTLSVTPSSDTDTSQSQLKYVFDLSLDNGTTWTNLTTTQPGQTSFQYDFTNTPATQNAKIRARCFDGTHYSGYAYVTFNIIHKIQLGSLRFDTKTGVVTIPVYDPNVGMSGKNQLRFKLNNNTVGCIELVDVNDRLSSHIHLRTKTGIKALALHD